MLVSYRLRYSLIFDFHFALSEHIWPFYVFHRRINSNIKMVKERIEGESSVSHTSQR